MHLTAGGADRAAGISVKLPAALPVSASVLHGCSIGCRMNLCQAAAARRLCGNAAHQLRFSPILPPAALGSLQGTPHHVTAQLQYSFELHVQGCCRHCCGSGAACCKQWAPFVSVRLKHSCCSLLWRCSRLLLVCRCCIRWLGRRCRRRRLVPCNFSRKAQRL
jgi:hypothetical protein